VDALPWNMDVSCMALIFFTVGNIVKMREIKINNRMLQNKILFKILFFSFIAILLEIINKKITGYGLDMFNNRYSIVVITYLAAFCGIFITCLLMIKIKSRILEYIGRNSLIYFALHARVFFTLIKFTEKQLGLLQGFNIINKIAHILIMFLLTMLLITLLNEIIKRTKLKFIVGK
jgi:hypothetical protein